MMCRGVGVVVALALLMVGCAQGNDMQSSGVTVGPPSGVGGVAAGSAGVASAGPGAAGIGAAGIGSAAAGGSGTAAAGTGPGPAGSGGAASTAGAMAAAGAGGIGGGTAGVMSAGTGAGTGAGGGPAPGGATPIVPDLTADCPDFRSGTITFMGLGGITLQAGSKASGPTAPMIFYWHGTGSFAGEYAGSAGAVHQGAMREGGVLISFQGTTGGDFLSGTAIFGAGDFELTDQLLACAVQNHNIDARRVFATGCSAGGLFSTAMAALRSNYIAAAAPNSGGWSFPSRFQNEWTPALMTIHGAPGVDVVGIDFSQSSARADMDFKARGSFVINCNHGGIHCGGGGLAPDIWEFFKAHPYGTMPSPWTGGLPSGFNSDCVIF